MRLATFNILHGRSLADGQVDLDRFSSAIAALDADILALQEVDRDQPRSHGADLTAVAAAAMDAPDHRFVATLSGTPDLWTAATGELQPNAASYGIALLSRYPVTSWHTHILPPLRGQVPVLFPGGTGRPVLIKDEQRAALAAVVRTPSGPLTVVATHLTFVPGWNAMQLRRLARVVRRLPHPVVVMGDLNIAGARPARITGWHSLASGATFPASSPVRQIDHILADGAVRAVADGESLDLGLSDHRALAVEIELT
ncbi:MAG: Endonuclease/exonuclease/phosphatase [Actinotalea sp.]|jgi:endonuclease/exonuclease/phosphatase family metal-dependent hydrolase|nr:Endonuclease/exonuclease/phosphatase [Actinotalea sp.]